MYLFICMLVYCYSILYNSIYIRFHVIKFLYGHLHRIHSQPQQPPSDPVALRQTQRKTHRTQKPLANLSKNPCIHRRCHRHPFERRPHRQLPRPGIHRPTARCRTGHVARLSSLWLRSSDCRAFCIETGSASSATWRWLPSSPASSRSASKLATARALSPATADSSLGTLLKLDTVHGK